MRSLSALAAGGLFGLGLLLSGMTDAARVQGFLDLAGNWDPTLAFVLGGAVLPMILVWRIAARRRVSALGTPIPAKPRTELDGKLVGGSALFGVGWALVGLCPGPAIVALGLGDARALIFFPAMALGMMAARGGLLPKRTKSATTPA